MGKHGKTPGQVFVMKRLANYQADIALRRIPRGRDRVPPNVPITLGEGGALAFYGASSGYRFTFMGKTGDVNSPAAMFTRKAGLRAGQDAAWSCTARG